VSTVFTAFFVAKTQVAIQEYLKYIQYGVKALQVTNPKARYVVLTDKETAPALEGYVEVTVTAPSDTPLMMAGILAQAKYTKKATDELTIHAAPDCMVARSLSGVFAHPTHGMVVTYRRPPEPINNVAYIRDHELAYRFLMQAAAKLETVRGHKVFDWGGDQWAWYQCLPEPWETLPADMGFHGLPESDIKRVNFDGSKIYLYTCTTHNHFVRNTGDPKRLTRNAFMLHFKGPRKKHMAEYLYKHMPYWLNIDKGLIEEDEGSADRIQRLLGGKAGKSTKPDGSPSSRSDRHAEREGA
jgi:hypothetical protein